MVKRKNLSKDSNQIKMSKVSNAQNLFIGAHVSIKGGLHETFNNAKKIGAKSFACFLRSKQKWDFKPLTKESIEKFHNSAKESNIELSKIVPHGSYLMNCGSPNDEVLKKSREMLIDELKRCDALGLELFNFHPGSSCGKQSIDETIRKIAKSINIAIENSEKVVVLIENMSCQGNTIGGKFSEIRDIMKLVQNKSRIGVCLDTCHTFAAGYDIKEHNGYEEMMRQFDEIIGLDKLRALHLNDSKSVCGSKLDRHEDIGKGKLGLEFFRMLMNDVRLNGLPLILETPGFEKYDKQIQILNGLVV